MGQTHVITIVNDMSNQDIDNYFTLAEACEAGYSTTQNALASQIRRGVLKAKRVGRNYIVHKDELERMVERRTYWINHRYDKSLEKYDKK